MITLSEHFAPFSRSKTPFPKLAYHSIHWTTLVVYAGTHRLLYRIPYHSMHSEPLWFYALERTDSHTTYHFAYWTMLVLYTGMYWLLYHISICTILTLLKGTLDPRETLWQALNDVTQADRNVDYVRGSQRLVDSVINRGCATVEEYRSLLLLLRRPTDTAMVNLPWSTTAYTLLRFSF